MSGIYGKGPKGKATGLHAALVRSRGSCERCGSTRSLQCAHILSRRYNATRTDETNALALCAGCHLFFGSHPFEFVEWVTEHLGPDEVARLRAKAGDASFQPREPFWKAEVQRLSDLLARVQDSYDQRTGGA